MMFFNFLVQEKTAILTLVIAPTGFFKMLVRSRVTMEKLKLMSKELHAELEK